MPTNDWKKFRVGDKVDRMATWKQAVGSVGAGYRVARGMARHGCILDLFFGRGNVLH